MHRWDERFCFCFVLSLCDLYLEFLLFVISQWQQQSHTIITFCSVIRSLFIETNAFMRSQYIDWRGLSLHIYWMHIRQILHSLGSLCRLSHIHYVNPSVGPCAKFIQPIHFTSHTHTMTSNFHSNRWQFGDFSLWSLVWRASGSLVSWVPAAGWDLRMLIDALLLAVKLALLISMAHFSRGMRWNGFRYLNMAHCTLHPAPCTYTSFWILIYVERFVCSRHRHRHRSHSGFIARRCEARRRESNCSAFAVVTCSVFRTCVYVQGAEEAIM